MKEAILGVTALIFAVIYNTILYVVNLKCADDELVNTAVLLMVLNTMKDAAVLTVILCNIFLG